MQYLLLSTLHTNAKRDQHSSLESFSFNIQCALPTTRLGFRLFKHRHTSNHIDKAGGSNERNSSFIDQRVRQSKAAHEHEGCTGKPHWRRGSHCMRGLAQPDAASLEASWADILCYPKIIEIASFHPHNCRDWLFREHCWLPRSASHCCLVVNDCKKTRDMSL